MITPSWPWFAKIPISEVSINRFQLSLAHRKVEVSNFTNAQTNQSPAQIESFFLKRVSDYSIAQIDNQTMLASRTDKMSFLEGSKVLIDGAISSITLSLASSLFRSGTGTIGQIGTITAGVIQLLIPIALFSLKRTWSFKKVQLTVEPPVPPLVM